MMAFDVPPPTDVNGVDLNPVQETPVATRKEDNYIHFCVDVEIQRHVEKLPKGNSHHWPPAFSRQKLGTNM